MTLGKTPGAHGASRPHSIFAALARRELDWPMARPASGPDLPVGASDGPTIDPPPPPHCRLGLGAWPALVAAVLKICCTS